MKERMKVICGTKSKDGIRTFWRTVGSAWPRDDGGMSIELFAMPAAQDGSYRMMVVHDDGQKPATKPLDDEIPY